MVYTTNNYFIVLYQSSEGKMNVYYKLRLKLKLVKVITFNTFPWSVCHLRVYKVYL
jgi:hypothetical protein